MTRETYFKLEPSPYYEGKYIIAIDFTKLPPMKTTGSYNLLFSSLLCLEYAEYLRFCRDIVGAEIIGKGDKYPVAYFKKDLKSTAFVRNLNVRMNLVMWEHNHPDWKEHHEYVKKKEEEKAVCRKEWSNVHNG